jgi:hypothetical protein
MVLTLNHLLLPSCLAYQLVGLVPLPDAPCTNPAPNSRAVTVAPPNTGIVNALTHALHLALTLVLVAHHASVLAPPPKQGLTLAPAMTLALVMLPGLPLGLTLATTPVVNPSYATRCLAASEKDLVTELLPSTLKLTTSQLPHRLQLLLTCSEPLTDAHQTRRRCRAWPSRLPILSNSKFLLAVAASLLLQQRHVELLFLVRLPGFGPIGVQRGPWCSRRRPLPVCLPVPSAS